MRLRYGVVLVGTTMLLTAGAVFAFVQIGAVSSRAPTPTAPWLAASDSAPAHSSPILPGPAEYERFAEEDRRWRAEHAREYSIAEIRARGDGRRTPRQAMQDRVFTLVRRGDRSQAIAELEQWVNRHATDGDAILWLARLLNEDGRKEASLRRYRQLMALQEDGR
jgi:hypothetical protein